MTTTHALVHQFEFTVISWLAGTATALLAAPRREGPHEDWIHVAYRCAHRIESVARLALHNDPVPLRLTQLLSNLCFISDLLKRYGSTLLATDQSPLPQAVEALQTDISAALSQLSER